MNRFWPPIARSVVAGPILAGLVAACDGGGAGPVPLATTDAARAPDAAADAARSAGDAAVREAGRPDAASTDAAPTDGSPALDATRPTDPDGGHPDAAPTEGGPTDSGPADAAPAVDAALPFAGFAPVDIAFLASMAGPAEPPPDPTNRFADDPAAARLGQALFYSPGLSPLGRDCAFCHPADRAFSGELSYDGHGGLRFRHAPSLVGAAFQPWLFWDGHADTLWSQVQGPLEDPEEMAATRLSALRGVTEDADLRAHWEAVYPPLPNLNDSARFPPSARPGPPGDPLAEAWETMAPADQAAVDAAFVLFAKALAAYVRRLNFFDSPFDRFVAALVARDEAGLAALSPEAQRGLRLFIGEAGCADCHHGPTLSDGDFHNVGLPAIEGRRLDTGRAEGIPQVVADVFNAAGPHSDDPAGPRARRLANLEPADAILGGFKTPTLRNVARTGPWMHDGRFRSLRAVVEYKVTLPGEPAVGERDRALQPVALDEGQILDLVAFLESLSDGPPPAELVGRPPPP